MKLLKALMVAHREKEKAGITDDWQTNTMARIKAIGQLKRKKNFIPLYEQLVWRLVPAVCTLIFVCTLFLINLDFTQEYKIAKALVDDPLQYALVQSIDDE